MKSRRGGVRPGAGRKRMARPGATDAPMDAALKLVQWIASDKHYEIEWLHALFLAKLLANVSAHRVVAS
jgi:hypothetical protein